MLSKIHEWKAQRDFEQGFKPATQEREGVLDSGYLVSIIEILTPIFRAIITGVAASLVLELLKMIFHMAYEG